MLSIIALNGTGWGLEGVPEGGCPPAHTDTTPSRLKGQHKLPVPLSPASNLTFPCSRVRTSPTVQHHRPAQAVTNPNLLTQSH